MLLSPLSISFEVTNACNNFCPHCYGSSWLRKGAKARPDILAVAQRIVESEVFDITITGGEPLLLNHEVLCRVIALFLQHETNCTLNSNGRLLLPGVCSQLKQTGLNQMLISLHSWSDALHDEIVDAPGAAVETKAGIANALQAGFRVTVNQVIDSRNIDTLYSSARELETMGVHSLAVTRALSPLDDEFRVEPVTASRFIDEFIRCSENLSIPIVSLLPIPYCADPRVRDLKGKLHCTGGMSTAVVSCFGDLRICPHDTKVWGNVLEEDLRSVWQRMMTWRTELAVPEACAECAFVLDCRAGCRIAAKLCGGDYCAKDPWAQGAITNYRRKVVLEKLDPAACYALVPGIRWRQEADACLLHSRNGRMLVNADGLEFVRRLPAQFRPEDLLQDGGVERESHLDFLRTLYHNGLLVEIARRSDGQVSQEIRDHPSDRRTAVI